MVDIKTYGMSRCVINFLYSMGDMGYRRSSKTAEINPPPSSVLVLRPFITHLIMEQTRNTNTSIHLLLLVTF